MFGSVVLEVFLGLAFLFMTLSLAVTTAQELIAGLLGMRAGNLIHAMRNLLGEAGPSLPDEVMAHPMLKRLYRGRARSILTGLIGNGPSYVPSEAFATALLDSLRRRNAKGTVASISLEDLYARAPDIVREMPDSSLKDMLTLMVGQLGETDRSPHIRIASIEQRLKTWFNEAMDRASGWYKRKSQTIVLLLAAILVVAVDADALKFMQQLWSDVSLRETLVTAAAAESAAGTQAQPEISQLLTQLELFPLGWAEGETLMARFTEPAAALRSVAGWLISILAVSLGAAFWFDLTKKALKLRSSGPKPDDASKAAG